MAAPALAPPEVIASVRRRVQGAVRGILVGGAPPVRDLTVPVAGDPGLFGPSSVTWRVHADSSMMVGGIRALLLQTMHPLAMAGVADHSAFRTEPLARLWNTTAFVGVTTYGTTDHAQAAIDKVLQVHEHVVGTAPDGRPYDANDPRLLSWVHHAMVDSFLTAYQRYGADPLDRHCADGYVAEMAVLAERIGAEEPARSVAGLRDVLAGFRPELAATAEAREGARVLALLPLPFAARPPYLLLLSAAVGLLPGWVRRGLHLPLLPGADPLLIRPSTRALTRFLGWAMRPEPASP